MMKMKSHALLYAGLLLLLVFLPAVAGLPGNAEGGDAPLPSASERSGPSEGDSVSENTDDAGQENREDEDVFRLLDTSTGEVLTVSGREFLYGAIVTEMPLLYEPEALKAQGVAAYTCYSRLRELQRANPDEDLKGADFSVNTADWYIYATKEQMQEQWGENFEDYYARLTEIVDDIYGKTLQSDGELITAVYFAVSGGSTEASADIWGGERSYLQPVASPWDAYAPGYRTRVRVTESEFQNTILAAYPEASFEGDSDNWVGEIRRTDAGSVTSLTAGGQEITGGEMRELFGLRSQNFTLSFQDGMAVFDVRGWGHGVGMSQVGANYLASQGMDYTEILAWYYPGVSIV